jgi:hypothetical protein
MHGYLNRYWSIAISLNPWLKKDNNQGNVWSCKTLLQIWEFSCEMWEHHNTILHNHQIKSSRQIRDTQINDEITKLYENIASCDVSDRWHFDLPLALCLCKPLQTQWRWLFNAKILVHKSPDWAMSGQMMLTSNLLYISKCSTTCHELFSWATNPVQ